MKNCLLTVVALLAFTQPGRSQDKPSPTPSATPTPAPVADSSSSASTASAAEAAAAAKKADPAKAADSPLLPGDRPPSPVTATTSESEATGNVVTPPEATATPSPSPSATSDTDFLTEPTDASLGAPVENLPSDTEPAPSELPNPDNLIPQGVSEGADVPPEPPKVVENKFDTARKLQVRYQEVKVQALKDPAVRSLNDQAAKAKNDEGRRQALREYYRLLFAKMTSIDPALKTKCDVMQQAYIRRLGQYRVSPSIPLKPPPTPAPLEN